MLQADPILAIATAPGKGGVGVARFSFPPAQPDVQAFAQALFGKLPAPRYAQLSKVRDDQSRLIDEGLLLLQFSLLSLLVALQSQVVVERLQVS